MRTDAGRYRERISFPVREEIKIRVIRFSVLKQMTHRYMFSYGKQIKTSHEKILRTGKYTGMVLRVVVLEPRRFLKGCVFKRAEGVQTYSFNVVSLRQPASTIRQLYTNLFAEACCDLSSNVEGGNRYYNLHNHHFLTSDHPRVDV